MCADVLDSSFVCVCVYVCAGGGGWGGHLKLSKTEKQFLLLHDFYVTVLFSPVLPSSIYFAITLQRGPVVNVHSSLFSNIHFKGYSCFIVFTLIFWIIELFFFIIEMAL